MARLFAVALLVGCSAFDPGLLDSVPDGGVPDAAPIVCTDNCELPNATAECVNEVCSLVSCNSGWGDCDSVPNNGCETDLTTSSCDPTRVTDGLVALYTFDEGSGTLVNDVSGVGSPLNLTIADPDNIEWVSEGLRVNTATIASSLGAATKVTSACQTANAVSLEAWVQPSVSAQMGPARIVTLSASASDWNVLLGQGQANNVTPDDRFAARLKTNTNVGSTDDGITPDGSASTALTHVVFVRGSDGSHSLYVDNQPYPLVRTPADSSAPDYSGDLSTWSSSAPLSLGNEVGGGRPWLGTYQLVAVYCSALSAADVSLHYSLGP